MSLRLADGESSVEIRMAERGGEIKVMVHTPDRDLANSLRSELPDLLGRLRQSGFQAESWRPQSPAEAAAGRRNTSDGFSFDQWNQNGRDGRRQSHPRGQNNQSRWDGEWKSSLDPAQEQLS